MHLIDPSLLSNFRRSYIPHQDWSLPDPIIHYQIQHPQSPKIYQKLTSCCKYPFIKHPILVIPSLKTDLDSAFNTVSLRINGRKVRFENLIHNYWVTKELFFHGKYGAGNVVSSLIPKIHDCTATVMIMRSQRISLIDLKHVSKCCERLDMKRVAVLDGSHSLVQLETIIKAFPKLREFRYRSKDFSPTVITSNTVTELLKYQPFWELDRFTLSHVPESFDMNRFYRDCILKNKKTLYSLKFNGNLPHGLEGIINQILGTQNRGYKPPCIIYGGMNAESLGKMMNFYTE